MATRKTEAYTLYQGSVSSPSGDWLLLGTDRGVCWVGTPGSVMEAGIAWAKRWATVESITVGDEIPPLRQAIEEMQRYLAGELTQFTCLLDLHGTPFQREVWSALLHIPYGETRTYQEIARAIGHPQAVRAVGAANGANPIALIIPCHRLIGSSGSLTGYGGGLPLKAWLLTHEKQGILRITAPVRPVAAPEQPSL